PTFTCGFVRSYFCLAMSEAPVRNVRIAGLPIESSNAVAASRARAPQLRRPESKRRFDSYSVRLSPPPRLLFLQFLAGAPVHGGAHERNRTADLLLTMQMLYRLSYVGLRPGTPAASAPGFTPH